MLLIGDDKSEIGVLHILGKQRMRADDKVKVTVSERGLDLTLLFCGHRTREQPDPQTERSEDAKQRVKMLLCQNFRRSHERTHVSAFCSVPYKRRRNERFAAADIALNEPVHRLARLHIGKGIAHRPPLRISRCKGQGRPKLVKVTRLHLISVGLAVLSLHPAESAGEQEQLLEYQPAPCKLQGGEIGGKVNVFICKARLRKRVFFTQRLRQNLRQLAAAGIQRLPYGVHHELLRQPSCQPVHGDYSARHAVRCILRLVHGVGHRPFTADTDYLAVEIKALPTAYVILEIGLIEICYVNRCTLIHDTELHKLHAAADAHEAGRVGNDALNAGCLTVTGERYGLKLAAIFVFSGEIGNKVVYGEHAELI